MFDVIKEKWAEILNRLKSEYEVTDVSFNTWLAPLKPASFENDTLYIVVPEESVGLQIIKKKYSKPLKVCVEEVTGINAELEFVLQDQFASNNLPLPERADNQKAIFETANLNPKYTFSSFVVGENNNLAHAAALAVAESPAEFYNPLFIYGGVGLGKTHLMQAIAHHILETNPEAKVLYVTSEEFTNEIIDAIRGGRSDNPSANYKFREKYRNVDVLLIDDIQFISGKESTQQEFFHTFNTLYENKKQIIISSDKPPKEIDNLEERLCSRFLWGLPVDIQSPNYETRVAILKKKIELENAPSVPDDVINYIAVNVSSNIRELEGALTKIIAYSKLTSTSIDLKFAENVLHDLFTSSREITPDSIIQIVADHFNVSINDILSKKKSQDIVYPRQLAMYLCRTQTDMAFSLIGKKMGNRDHSTVLHSYEKIHKEIEENDKIRMDVEALTRKISPS